MSDQIAELMAELDITREQAIAIIAIEAEAEAERAARGDCGRCKHYKPDPEAGRRYFGVPNADSGWCTNTTVRPAHKDDQYTDMLSGDWCQQYEAKQ